MLGPDEFEDGGTVITKPRLASELRDSSSDPGQESPVWKANWANSKMAAGSGYHKSRGRSLCLVPLCPFSSDSESHGGSRASSVEAYEKEHQQLDPPTPSDTLSRHSSLREAPSGFLSPQDHQESKAMHGELRTWV